MESIEATLIAAGLLLLAAVVASHLPQVGYLIVPPLRLLVRLFRLDRSIHPQRSTGLDRLLNRQAEVIEEFAKSPKTGRWEGRVRLQGEQWKACLKRSAYAGLSVGSKVRVCGAQGLTLLVEPAGRGTHKG